MSKEYTKLPKGKRVKLNYRGYVGALGLVQHYQNLKYTETTVRTLQYMETNNFITNYLTYSDGCETPEIYDLWGAISTLASIATRRVWVNLGYFKFYPNLYVVLVGPPGGRKTSAMNISLEILAELGEALNISSDCMTKEVLCKNMGSKYIKTFNMDKEVIDETTGQPGIINGLVEYSPITLGLTELSHFLGINSAHMIDFLVTIFDKDRQYKAETKNKGDDIIPRPCVNIIACTTPNNITRYLKEDVISGGFSRRSLFIFENDDGDPIAFPVVTKEASDARLRCIQWGQRLLEVTGEFQWTQAAKDWYAPWYNELFESLKNYHDLTRGYYKSKHIQLLKVAMLFALAEDVKLVIDVHHLQLALGALEKAERKLGNVYSGMGRNELSAIAARVVDMLETCNQPVPEKDINVAFYRDADAKELYNILQHLKSVGKIFAVNQKTGPDGSVLKLCYCTQVVAKRIGVIQ